MATNCGALVSLPVLSRITKTAANIAHVQIKLILLAGLGKTWIVIVIVL